MILSCSSLTKLYGDQEVLKNITLTADEHLEYKDIVDTMSILKNMNIENISLNIQNKN